MATINVDMDGTLTEFEYVMPEIWMSKGYFRRRPPQNSVIKAVKLLLKLGFDVKILSAVVDDDLGPERIREKNEWLDEYLPEISKENRVFVPYGCNKSEYIDVHEDDILLDDYSKNLHSWKGIGIKVKNGLNGTKGSWKGYEVSTRQTPAAIANTIASIASYRPVLKDLAV